VYRHLRKAFAQCQADDPCVSTKEEAKQIYPLLGDAELDWKIMSYVEKYVAPERKDAEGIVTQQRTAGWKSKLAELLKQNNHLKLSGKGNTSYRTRDERSEKLYLIFNTLRELRYGIEDPANLKPKHVETLVNYWIDNKYAASTIDNNLSHLRALSVWIGKEGLVKPLSEYAPEVKREYAARTDKSFVGNDVDFEEVWKKVRDMDEYVAMQLLFVKAFGARRKEAVMFKPLIADHGLYIELFAGTKGGRPRIVAIDNDQKRAVITLLKNFVAKKTLNAKGHIGHPDKDLAQNLKRYSYVLGACGINKKDLGVTGHGLRAEYVIDKLIGLGVVPTIRGGDGKAETKLETDIAYLRAAEDTGHSRKSVVTAYAGALMAPKLAKSGEEPDSPVEEDKPGRDEPTGALPDMDEEPPESHMSYPDSYEQGGQFHG
jgi:site-specific recombinase XerD